MQKYKIIFILLIVPFVSTNTFAAQKLSTGSLSEVIAWTSDYAPRGIDQSEGKPAMYVGTTYDHNNGLYGSLGIATIEYNYDKDAFAEIDLFVGYKKTIGGINFNIAGVGYVYPGTFDGNDYSFFEYKLAASKTFDLGTFSAAVQYSPDYWMHTGEGIYIPVTANIPIKNGFSLITGAAHQSVENNTKIAVPDWWNWYGGISYDYDQFDFSIKYMDSNVEKIKCNNGSNDCNSRFVFTVMKFF